MILLQLNQITKYFGADLILSNIKLEVQAKDRIALVGRNGAGKSTLLKIIAGELARDSGDIIKPKDLSIGYLSQDTGLDSELSIWDEMLTVFERLRRIEKQLRNLEEKMGDPSLIDDAIAYPKLLKEYDELQLTFKDDGGYQYEADIRSVLHGLNFAGFDEQTLVQSLSGGQRTRLALAKLLLLKPDLLILDEPTNHLDIETLSWLEQYLQSYPGAILLVSHDRYFLDKIVNQVYEISRTTSTKFHGNYSKYLAEKSAVYEREQKEFEKQQKEIERMKDFIQKNIARASTTKRAQSKRKQLDKMHVIDKPLADENSASFHFDIERQSGNDVLRVTDLSFAYNDEAPIFAHLNFHLTRGDSVSLVGPNGIGKSTLLKIITQDIEAKHGQVHFGSNVTIGYYDQDQTNLHHTKTVLQELWDEYPEKAEKEIRTVLGNFLFSGDDVLKKVSALSGGEKARLSLAKLMLKKANLLILDEPTNHLDLDSKEILENALIDYPGTILFVSHDRYFINRLATKVIEMSKSGLFSYLGDYDYYVEKKAELLEIEKLEHKELDQASTAEKTKKDDFLRDKEAQREERKKQRRIEELEHEISTIEQEIETRERLLCDPDVYQDYEKSTVINNELGELQQKVAHYMDEWELLQDD